MRSFIKNYIYKITIYDIKNFGIKNGIVLSDDELSILEFHLKNNWEKILYGNPSPIIREIESNFDKAKSEKIINLFNIYKEKYKYYL
ncbi:MAG: hypothetical protein IKF91_05985 [Bacilli bacterium]|nr:hypothetical protein [Bacilli bacterium]